MASRGHYARRTSRDGRTQRTCDHRAARDPWHYRRRARQRRRESGADSFARRPLDDRVSQSRADAAERAHTMTIKRFAILVAVATCARAAVAQSPAPQKAVLVTGASTGIGRKIAERLASSGFLVYAGA